MTEAQSKALRKVIKAWTEVGPVPTYHQVIKIKLLKMWPTLYNALVELEKEMRRD